MTIKESDMLRVRLIIKSFLLLTFCTGCQVYSPVVERIKYNLNGYSEWSGEGVVHSLPMVGFDLIFEVSKTELESPKCDANKLTDTQLEAMGIDPGEIGSGKRTYYTLHSTKLNPRSVSDPNKVFVTRYPKHSFWADTSVLVKLGNDGIIEGIDGASASKSMAIGAKLLEFTASVGKGVVGFGAAARKMQPKECENKAIGYFHLQEELAAYRAMGVPFPKDTLDLYISEIKAEQAAILALFIGKPTVHRGIINCFIAPNNAGDQSILNVDKSLGFKKIGGDSCEIDQVFLNPRAVGPKGKLVSIRVEEIDDTIKAVYEKRGANIPSAAGLYYSVPVRAYVSISGHPKANIDRQSFLLPQLGSLNSIPRVKGYSPALIGEYYPDTGALKSVKVVNNAADLAALIGSASTSTGNYLSARAEAEDEKRAAAKLAASERDPLTLLKREQAILESTLAIETAREALKN